MYKIYSNFEGTISLKSQLENIYRIKWSNYIDSCQSKGKLSTYAKFKKEFKLENYLLQFPSYFRRNFSKLRISAHNLAIETGRYTKPTETPREKRICFHCKEIENEFHFIFNCPLYSTYRETLYTDLSNILSLNISPSEDLFRILMSGLNGDLEVGKYFCDFLNKCFSLRSEMLSYSKETNILQRNKSVVTRSGRVSKRPTIFDL